MERRQSHGTELLPDQAVPVGPVNLLGVPVTALVLLDHAEHRRRRAVSLGAVTDPGLPGCLLGLPAGELAFDQVLWAEVSLVPGGVVGRGDDGCTVTRLLEPPLVVTDVVVAGRRGRELRAVQDASLFAAVTRRWVRTSGEAVPVAVVLAAKLCGAGLLSPHDGVILAAGQLAPTTAGRWAWLLAERRTGDGSR